MLSRFFQLVKGPLGSLWLGQSLKVLHNPSLETHTEKTYELLVAVFNKMIYFSQRMWTEVTTHCASSACLCLSFCGQETDMWSENRLH